MSVSEHFLKSHHAHFLFPSASLPESSAIKHTPNPNCTVQRSRKLDKVSNNFFNFGWDHDDIVQNISIHYADVADNFVVGNSVGEMSLAASGEESQMSSV